MKYSASPLANLIVEILDEITKVELKYCPDASDSPDKLQAAAEIAEIKKLLLAVHDILPLFDDQNIPGVSSLILPVKTMFGFKKLANDLNQKLKIDHPMKFELVTAILGPLMRAPQDIRDLIPFLNPDALLVDLYSGVTGYAIQAATGKNYLFQRVEKENAPYAYQLTTFRKTDSGATKKEQEIDLGALYTSRLSSMHRFILSEIRRYFTENLSLPTTHNELMRAEFLQKLSEAESAAIEQAIGAYQEAEKQAVDFDALNSVALLTAIDNQIKRYDSLVANNQELQRSMLAKKESYQSSSLKHFFASYPELAALVENHPQFDSSYYEVGLPENVVRYVVETNAVEVTSIRSKLNNVIASNYLLLQESELALQQKLMALTQQRENAFKTCWDEFKATFSIQITAQQHQLAIYEMQLNDLSDLEEERLITGNAPIDFEPACAAVFERSQRLQALHAMLVALQAPRVPEWLQLDINVALAGELNILSQPLVEASQLLFQKIELAQQQVQKKSAALHARLEKAKAEAAFNENLRSADPEKMKQLLCQVTEQRVVIKESFRQLQVQQDETTAELNTKISLVDSLSAEKTAVASDILILEQTNHSLLQQLFAIIENCALIPTLKSKQEQGMTSDAAIDLVAFAITELNTQKAANARADLTAQHADIITLLQEIQAFLAREGVDKKTVPFNEIEQLPAMVNRQLNFNALLAMIDQSELISDWENYRGIQDSYVWSTVYWISAEDVSDRLATLKNAVDRQVMSLTALAPQDQQHQEAGKKITAALEEFTQLNDQLITAQEKIAAKHQALALIESQYQSQHALREQLQQKQNEGKQALQQTIVEQHQLETSEKVLAQIIAILAQIDELKSKIESFAAIEECNLTNDQFLEWIIVTTNEHNELETKIQAVTESLLMLNNNALYTATLNAIGQVLLSIKQRFDQAMDEKLNSKLEQMLEQEKQAFGLFQQALNDAKANKAITNDLYSAHMNSMVSECEQLCESMHENSAEIADLKMQLSSLSDVMNSEQIQAKELARGALFTEVGALAVKINQQNEALAGYLQTRNEQISSLLIALRAFSNQEPESKPQPDVEATEADAQFIASQLKLLSNLITQLDGFDLANASSAQLMIEAINQKVTDFKDFHIQLILNKITVTIVDAERQMTHILHEEAESLDNYEFYHQKAMTILAGQKQSHKDYVEKMESFYKDIAKIYDYGVELKTTDEKSSSIIIELATKLRNDVDHFVINHPNTPPDQKSYQQFKQNFMARLHSNDDIDIKLRMEWLALIANVAIGVCTVGVVLVARLIYTKQVTGRAKLFFAPDNIYKDILQDVDSSVEEIDPVVAVSCAATMQPS